VGRCNNSGHIQLTALFKLCSDSQPLSCVWLQRSHITMFGEGCHVLRLHCRICKAHGTISKHLQVCLNHDGTVFRCSGAPAGMKLTHPHMQGALSSAMSMTAAALTPPQAPPADRRHDVIFQNKLYS